MFLEAGWKLTNKFVIQTVNQFYQKMTKLIQRVYRRISPFNTRMGKWQQASKYYYKSFYDSAIIFIEKN